MTSHPHRARRAVTRGTASVAVVLGLSGALFAANARLADDPGARHPEDLADLASSELDRVDRLASDVDSLRTQVDGLAAGAGGDAEAAQAAPPAAYLVEGGSVPVVGPGVTVRLDDAPVDSPRRDDVSPDVLVVHQQDLQAVMNALWAGGAEAMGLMDQRVISTSAFRCVGNVLRLQGRVYSPPYLVHAIGDPARLREALDASPAVRAFQRDAADVGLGWAVVTADDPLELPAYSGATDLESARVPEGVEVLPGAASGQP